MLHNLWKCLFCLNEFNNFVAFPRRYHRRHDVSCHSDVRQQRLMPIGEGMGTRHIEGVYLTLCSWLSETSQTLDTVNEPSNGRCLRVWLYHGQWSIVPMLLFSVAIGIQYSMWRHIYHIGVGSSVVCSTVSGNAKASEGGTDGERFPRLNQYVFCKCL